MKMTSFKIWVLITSKLRRLYPIFGVKRLDPLGAQLHAIKKLNKILLQLFVSMAHPHYFKQLAVLNLNGTISASRFMKQFSMK